MGRGLRALFGLILIVYVTPIYLRLPSRIFFESLLLMAGLVVLYCLIQIAVVRRVVGPYLGTTLAHMLLVALYAAGFFQVPVFGNGKGQLAAVTFFGISLVIAGIRGVAGCELMAIPGLFLRQDIELACLIFSPLDRLECRLRRTRDDSV